MASTTAQLPHVRCTSARRATGAPLGSRGDSLRTLLVAGILLALAGCEAKAAADQGLVFVIDPLAAADPERPYYHDFGNVHDGDTVEHVFRLRNASAHPITITDVVPACGCTVPRVSYTGADGELVLGKPVRTAEGAVITIPPDVVLDLALRMDTHSVRTKNAHQLYATRVSTDSDVTAYFTLETHILVENPFQIVPNKLALGRVPIGGGGSSSLDIVPISGFRSVPTKLGPLPAGVTAELREETRMGRRLWVLTARLEPPLTAGHFDETLSVETLDEEGQPGRALEIRLTALAVPDIQPTPARLIVVRRPGHSVPAFATVQIASLLPGHRLRITAADVAAEHREVLTVDFAPEASDSKGRSGTWNLSLHATGTLPDGVLKGEVRVVLDDPQAETVLVPYVVHAG